MLKDDTIRRNKIHEFIFDRKDRVENTVTVKIIQRMLLETTLTEVIEKTILRDLKRLCKDYDALNRDKSSKPVIPYQWCWDKNEEDIELPIPLDTTTAMSLLAAQKFIKDMLPPIQSLEYYFNQAKDELEVEDEFINSWLNKIEVVPLPHDLNLPEPDDGDAFQEILNALYKDKCFKADYSGSAYDLNELGKWDKQILNKTRTTHTVYPDRIYHPLGMFRHGPVYFLVAYVTDRTMVVPRSWKANHFAMHKFAHVEIGNKDVDRVNFSLKRFISEGRFYGASTNPMQRLPENIDLEIYVSQEVGEYLDESAPHNLNSVKCRTCAGTERRGGDRDRRGWRCFRGTTRDTDQLKRWLFSLRDVEVLAPPELRENFKAVAVATLSYYP